VFGWRERREKERRDCGRTEEREERVRDLGEERKGAGWRESLSNLFYYFLF